MQKQTLGTQSQKKESYKNYEMERIRGDTKKNTKKEGVDCKAAIHREYSASGYLYR